MVNAVSKFLCFTFLGFYGFAVSKFLGFWLFEIVYEFEVVYGCLRIFFEHSEKTFVLFVLFVVILSFERSENALCILSALSTFNFQFSPFNFISVSSPDTNIHTAVRPFSGTT